MQLEKVGRAVQLGWRIYGGRTTKSRVLLTRVERHEVHQLLVFSLQCQGSGKVLDTADLLNIPIGCPFYLPTVIAGGVVL